MPLTPTEMHEVDRKVGLMKFCPVCGKELEIHPLTGDPACFLHGDVRSRNGEVFFQLVRNVCTDRRSYEDARSNDGA